MSRTFKEVFDQFMKANPRRMVAADFNAFGGVRGNGYIAEDGDTLYVLDVLDDELMLETFAEDPRDSFQFNRIAEQHYPTIRVYDNGGATADRYTVFVNASVYLMSADAMQANGVNMYAGESSSGYHGADPEVSVDSLPEEVQRAIAQRKGA